MTVDDVPSVLDQLVSPVSQHLIPLLRRGISASVERHAIADGDGADSFSFGTDVWSLPARLFRDAAADDGDEFPFNVEGGGGCVLVGFGARVRHHKVGQVETDNIASSFPNGAKALVAEAAQRQMQLFEEPEFKGADSDDSIVLAYMANPTDGLCSAYLCEVGEIDEKERIVSWSKTRLIYMRGLNPDPEKSASDLVPEEKTPEPMVRRIKKAKSKNDK